MLTAVKLIAQPKLAIPPTECDVEHVFPRFIPELDVGFDRSHYDGRSQAICRMTKPGRYGKSVSWAIYSLEVADHYH